ncbi:MAG: N-acetylneuraminate synthase family protein [Leptospiraceae bacterium]|nr:N-acetylneuraminate synthase family protein [Leptospiraceae bacterium]MDW7975566.1 N-acetylneuraminate synthase family protein [Leptospiraceae bacterium]
MKTEYFDFENQSLPYVIAEIGINHNGNEDLAIKMIEQAAKAGANAVKFQLYKTENFIEKKASLPLAFEGSLFDFFQRYEFPQEVWMKLKKVAHQNKVDFLCSVFDDESLRFYHEKLNSKMIKVASTDINNYLLLEKIKELNYQFILSTGATEEQEIEQVVERFGKPFAILECVSNYPSQTQDYLLSLLPYWEKKYECLVGVSDHTLDHKVSLISVLFGGRLIEIHFTIDKKLSGPDQKLSITPKELKKLKQEIKIYNQLKNEPIKLPKQSEENVRMFGRRSLFYNKNLQEGSILKKEDLIALRPGGGIPPSEYEHFINKTLKRNVKKGERLHYYDFF